MTRSLLAEMECRCMPEPNSGCLLWLGALGANGYAYARVDGRTQALHRLICEEVNGPVPAGYHVLHSCDTRSCIAPEHLRAGTPQENVDDCVRRGRQARGSMLGQAKLTEEIVARGRAEGLTPATFAQRHDVSQGTALKVLTGASWRHVPTRWTGKLRPHCRRAA